MTVVMNGPSVWPIINLEIVNSYWMVAAGVVVVYDWVLTIGQEIELIWRQRWSLMTVLYLLIRYIGIPYSAINTLPTMPLVSLGDAGCNMASYVIGGTNVVVAAMLGVIMISRLHAMYQGSRTMLIFLVITFLAVNIACMVIGAIVLKDTVGDELILSGMYMCHYVYDVDVQLLTQIIWVLNTVWEVLALSLSAWIAVKYFRDLRRFGPSRGRTFGDCFRVLIRSHVLYFAIFVWVSCLQIATISPEISNSSSIGTQIFDGALYILSGLQLFVLGPRLILSVREHHAKLVANSDAETSMNSIVFEERVYVTTSSTV